MSTIEAFKGARKKRAFACQERSRGNGKPIRLASSYFKDNDVTLLNGDCLALLETMPDECAQLIVTSPPYNIGKEYEEQLNLSVYLQQQSDVIRECVRILHPKGNLCWQVGNHVDRGGIIPLDSVLFPIFSGLGLKMRNRIVWHFEHGLHCTRRLSGRYEVIVWYTKSDDYQFQLDPVRVPQKYPGKRHFKGPKIGEFSCNPKGKNPGDVWMIPNVKNNHVEKTVHPCQFPVELIERLVLSMTYPGNLVVDPFMGVGTTAVAALRHGRRSAGAEIVESYYENAIQRILLESRGQLATRPMGQPVHQPSGREKITQNPFKNGHLPERFR